MIFYYLGSESRVWSLVVACRINRLAGCQAICLLALGRQSRSTQDAAGNQGLHRFSRHTAHFIVEESATACPYEIATRFPIIVNQTLAADPETSGRI